MNLTRIISYKNIHFYMVQKKIIQETRKPSKAFTACSPRAILNLRDYFCSARNGFNENFKSLITRPIFPMYTHKPALRAQ